MSPCCCLKQGLTPELLMSWVLLFAVKQATGWTPGPLGGGLQRTKSREHCKGSESGGASKPQPRKRQKKLVASTRPGQLSTEAKMSKLLIRLKQLSVL